MKEDNPFKEKLYHHTVPVRDELWNRIESHLPEKVDKKRFPFFWVTFASILVMAGAILFWPKTKPATDPKPPIQEIQKEKETPVTQPVESPVDVSSPLEAAPYSSDVEVNTTYHIPSDAGITAITASKTSAIHQSQNTFNTTPGSKIPSLTDASQSSNPGSTKLNMNSVPATIGSPPEFSYQTEEGNQITSSNPILSQEQFTQRTVTHPGSIKSLPMATLSAEEEMETPDADIVVSQEIDKIKPDPTCYKFTKKESKSNLSFDIFGGHGFSPRSFQSTGLESAIYAQARETTERNQYSWSAGGRINLNLNREFAVRAGLMYEQSVIFLITLIR